MNQTTWIVTGGIAIIAVAGLLFMLSGDGLPKANTTPNLPITNDTVTQPTANTATPESATNATIRTSLGDITIKFYPSDAPKTVENFLKLSREGFYNGVKFHRVIEGFMNQAGDPLSKDDSMKNEWGTGGPNYQFPDEINRGSALYQRGYKFGVVAMANSGPNTNGSQFFIMAKDTPLPPNYTIFGEVTEGLDVVTKINTVQTDGNDRPLVPVTINSVEVK